MGTGDMLCVYECIHVVVYTVVCSGNRATCISAKHGSYSLNPSIMVSYLLTVSASVYYVHVCLVHVH